jgi:phenylacetate-CoA ligase
VSLQQRILERSPLLVRRGLINVEAVRRDWFRRTGDYAAEVRRHDPRWYERDRSDQEDHQLARLQHVVTEARNHVPYYRERLPQSPIRHLADVRSLPVLRKLDVAELAERLVDERLPKRELWRKSTSGSTGTPLCYYSDREATRAHQALADAMTAHLGCEFGERRARFSGVLVVPFERSRPPYWLYIDHYHQLQCSAYHLSPDRCADYLRAMADARVRYGTGYATAWHVLAAGVLAQDLAPPALRAIITDSEGISLDQQREIELAFHCPVYQTYGTGELGQVAQQCAGRRYHVLTRSCIAEVLDERDRPVAPGETGRVVVTDLTATRTPFIRYETGDLATTADDDCGCGWKSPTWTEIVGRVDDRVLTPDGRWIGRLSHVTKPGIGIVESQIAQVAADAVEIRVVPGHRFEEASMTAVIEAAQRYLGASMRVSWTRVDRLPRTAGGKLRHVVREVGAAPESEPAAPAHGGG